MVTDARYWTVRNTQEVLHHSHGSPKDFKDMMRIFGPEYLAEHLGLTYIPVESLDNTKRNLKTAGMLSIREKCIFISEEFPPEQSRLTGLHECVHFMVHKDIINNSAHRDRPINPRDEAPKIPYHEWEATHLACRWLMPEKLVRERFLLTFKRSLDAPFVVDDNTAYHLNISDESLSSNDPLDLLIPLVKTNQFHEHIEPLHKQFRVSPTAMAIRLIELGLDIRGKRHLKPV